MLLFKRKQILQFGALDQNSICINIIHITVIWNQVSFSDIKYTKPIFFPINSISQNVSYELMLLFSIEYK